MANPRDNHHPRRGVTAEIMGSESVKSRGTTLLGRWSGEHRIALTLVSLQRVVVARYLADNGSLPRRSPTDREADQ